VLAELDPRVRLLLGSVRILLLLCSTFTPLLLASARSVASSEAGIWRETEIIGTDIVEW
jgi:hypothetical protein